MSHAIIKVYSSTSCHKDSDKNQDGERGMEKIIGLVLKTETQAGNSCLRCTPNRAVLESILADLDLIWELRHCIPKPWGPILSNVDKIQ